MNTTMLDYLSLQTDNEILLLENEYLNSVLYDNIYVESDKEEKPKSGLVAFIHNMIQKVKDFFNKIFGGKGKGDETVVDTSSDLYKKKLALLKTAADNGEKIKCMDIFKLNKVITEMCHYIDGAVLKFVHDLKGGMDLTKVSAFTKTFEKRLNQFDNTVRSLKEEKNYKTINAKDAYNWYSTNMDGHGPTGYLRECLDKVDDASATMSQISKAGVEQSAGVGFNMYPEGTKQVFQNAITSIKGSGVVIKYTLSTLAAAVVTGKETVKAVKSGQGISGIASATQKGAMASKLTQNLADATSNKEKYQLKMDISKGDEDDE